jgi:hypothetical protein
MRLTNKMSFQEAKTRYIHRFTMEHVPVWAERPGPDGKYHAPEYQSDAEWYDNTMFPPHTPFLDQECHSTGRTWPLGTVWLDKPYTKTQFVPHARLKLPDTLHWPR